MLITGASRGIGAATAVMAAKRGYDVAINYVRSHEAAEGVAQRCISHGARATVVQADVADPAQVVAMFRTAIGALGPIDVFVNNAGVLHAATRFDEISAERLHEVMQVNVIGAFMGAREAVRHMSTRHGGAGGAIVNVSSSAAYVGSPNEYVDYAATKGAIDTMTIGLSKEVAAEGVRVNAVRPGLIYTDIHQSSGVIDRVSRLAPGTPMQRGGQPDEVAEAILWLASDAASYVTGCFINTTGGR